MAVATIINNVMRPFSMYKGMSLGLIGIWSAAFVLSFFGVISFSPVALAISAIILVVATYVTSLLCAKLFGVSAHFESSLITGLILALIFTPTLDAAGLVVLAFVGMIAGASKYIVVWKGRHIFNPAAFGAAVVALAGLGAASWWVATPPLALLVILVTAMSLYRTKQYLVPAVFLVITVPALFIQLLNFGVSPFDSAWALLSWPLLFAAGIMLTEPLTLPPKRWQMCIVAAVVAILFVVPFKIGTVEVSPALALLVGNLLAFILARRKAVVLTLKQRKAVTPTTDEFVFTQSAPLYYEAGQFAEISLPHAKADLRGSRRSFSMTSTPGDKELSFAIKFYEPSSSYKKALRKLPVGGQVQIVNNGGDFTLPKNDALPLLYVAGGIGITPFISHLRWLHSVKQQRDYVLVYAVSDSSEIAYKGLLEKSGVEVVIVSPTKPADLPKNWKFIKSARVTQDDLAAAVPDIPTRTAFISGPPLFVQSAKHSLRKLKAFKIKTDYFSGY